MSTIMYLGVVVVGVSALVANALLLVRDYLSVIA